jgi:hypothetical protein
MVLSKRFLVAAVRVKMYVNLFIAVDKGKVLVPWTIVNIDDAQDCTFLELFGKIEG